RGAGVLHEDAVDPASGGGVPFGPVVLVVVVGGEGGVGDHRIAGGVGGDVPDPGVVTRERDIRGVVEDGGDRAGHVAHRERAGGSVLDLGAIGAEVCAGLEVGIVNVVVDVA